MITIDDVIHAEAVRSYFQREPNLTAPQTSITGVNSVDDLLLRRVVFVSPGVVDGLVEYEAGVNNQHFFYGFQCDECRRIFLVREDWESLAVGCSHDCEAQRG